MMNPWASGPFASEGAKSQAFRERGGGGGRAAALSSAGGSGAEGANSLRRPPASSSPWVFTQAELTGDSPSREDGISAEEEVRTINTHVEKIIECANGLKLLGVPVYIAIVLFRRYFIMESLKGAKVQAIAAASLFLAGKISEHLRSCKDVIYWSVKVWTQGCEDFPDGEEINEYHVRFFEEKESLLVAERDILRVMNFDLDIDLPHNHVRSIVTEWFGNGTTARNVKQSALNLMVDSFGSDLHLQYETDEVAVVCLLAAMAYLHLELPEASSSPAWLSRWDRQRLQTLSEEIFTATQKRRLEKLYRL